MREIGLLIYLAVLGLFDWRERKVPLILLIGGLMAAFLYQAYLLYHSLAEWQWFLVSALLGVLPGFFMLIMARLTDKVGYGDGLVLLNIGLLTSYKSCILLLCFSTLTMSIFSIGLLLLKKVKKDTKLPYLPFLTAVYAFGMLVTRNGGV